MQFFCIFMSSSSYFGTNNYGRSNNVSRGGRGGGSFRGGGSGGSAYGRGGGRRYEDSGPPAEILCK